MNAKTKQPLVAAPPRLGAGFATLAALAVCAGAPFGCATEAEQDILEDAADTEEGLDEQDDNLHPDDASGQLQITVDGEDRPDLIIAEQRADESTRLFFVQNDSPEGSSSIDVVIVGKDGGFDYGGLLGPEGATPLELYLAVADDSAAPPEMLVQDHERQVERTGRDGIDDLAGHDLPWVPGHGPSGNSTSTTGLSSFTCRSWSNFQFFMGSIHSGWAGRAQVVSAPTTGFNDLYLPNPWNWYPTGSADLVVCNYRSNNPSVIDVIDGKTCHWRTVSNPSETCSSVLGGLSDGHYIRRVYGWQASYRRYRVKSTPLNGEILQSYLGIVRSNS